MKNMIGLAEEFVACGYHVTLKFSSHELSCHLGMVSAVSILLSCGRTLDYVLLVMLTAQRCSMILPGTVGGISVANLLHSRYF